MSDLTLPPHNIEAEKGCLASMIFDNTIIPVVRRILGGYEDFYRDVHQMLYRVVCDLNDRCKPVDGISIAEELRRHDWTEEFGGELIPYLAEVMESVATEVNGHYYAQVVHEKALARAVREGAIALIRSADSNEMTSSQLVAAARGMVDEAEFRSPTWDEPEMDGLPEAAAFPLDVFPDPLQRLVAEAAATFPCPADFLAIPCLAAASVAVGRSVAIAVKTSWVESASFYMAFCAPPGSIKSEALKVAISPLFELQSEQLFHDLAAREVAREMARAKKAAGGQPGEDRPPPLRRILVDDATTERLAVLLSENPRGLLMAADELTGWIGGMNQYKSGGNDRQFYLRIWSGSAIITDRKSQEGGVPIIVPHPCLTICGAMTPEKLRTLEGDGSDDGFLDRILLSYPAPVRVRFNNEPLSAQAKADWADALGRLHSRPMEPDDRGGFRPHLVRFTEPALREFADWFNGHCDETTGADFASHLRGPWAKMRGYCARFALVLDALEWSYDVDRSERPRDVGVGSLRKAIRLIDYFKSHARRCYHAIKGETSSNDDAQAVLEWAKSRHSPRFTMREAKDNFRRRFASSPLGLAEALDWLSQRGALRIIACPPSGKLGGRRPGGAFELHPSLAPKRPQNAQSRLSP